MPKIMGFGMKELWIQNLILLSMYPTILLTGFSLVAQLVKNVSAMQETQVWSLGWEDPLWKEMETHSSTLAIDRGAWRAIQSMGSQELDMT